MCHEYGSSGCCACAETVYFKLAYCKYIRDLYSKTKSVALVRERTIPTERPPLVVEISANFCE
jgi:hypothetical protein